MLVIRGKKGAVYGMFFVRRRRPIYSVVQVYITAVGREEKGRWGWEGGKREGGGRKRGGSEEV